MFVESCYQFEGEQILRKEAKYYATFKRTFPVKETHEWSWKSNLCIAVLKWKYLI